VSGHPWEAQGVFNGCPVRKDGKVYLVYRALSLPHHKPPHRGFIPVSSIGIAESEDGLHFHDRRQLVIPEQEWESYSCEDPRVTYLDGKFLIAYTAVANHPPSADEIRIGLAISKDLEKVEERHLVTHFNSKGMAIFPERIGNKVWAVLTVHTDDPPARISLASFDKVEDLWNRGRWEEWYKNLEENSLTLQRSPEDHIEVGAPPIKTERGWLLFYSYIDRYFIPEKRLFTIEALLLDLSNPLKVIARTNHPLLVPEEYYEKVGYVQDVVFPSGALKVDDGNVLLYYGGADTVCCVAQVDLAGLLAQLLERTGTPKFVRAIENPTIVPERPWEARGVFNPAAVRLADRVHIVYRAQSQDGTSVLGYASSHDGIQIDYRSPEPIYVPREEFELKQRPGFSGCEDPRLTVVGDRIYMCYTAFNGNGPPRVALTSIEVDDFLGMKWNSWEKPVLISPPGLDDKDACVFPEKVKDPKSGEEMYLLVHRLGLDMDYALVPSLDFDGNTWLEECQWIRPRRGSWDSVKVGLAAPPFKTEEGWIMLYHGVDDASTYRVGAVLLSLQNPLEVIGRTEEPIFEPEEKYEKQGMVNNVVFPCGSVNLGGKTYIYYGGADRVIGVASLETNRLLGALLPKRNGGTSLWKD
jgi:predicted GH43/DUF377 family glycosyl hydrolase